jgi:hypothetical protein
MRILISLLCLAAPLALHAQSFTVQKKTTHAPEMGALAYLSVQHGHQEFSLMPPVHWPTEMQVAQKKVRFSSPDHSAVLVIAFSTNEALAMLSAPQALAVLAPEVNVSTNAEDFPAFSSDRQGQGIETSFALNGHAMRCRAAVIPIEGGVVSFVLTCSSNELESARQVFAGALTSFQHCSPSRRDGAHGSDLAGVNRLSKPRRADD